MNAFEVEVGVVFQESSDVFQVLEGWFIFRAIINCRDLNAFISVYDLFTNVYWGIISNRVHVLKETEAASIQIPLWNMSFTFNGGLNFATSLSLKLAWKNRV